MTLRQHKRLSAKPRTWRYTWDADDRLTGVTTPDGQRWRYRYDPFSRRIAKQHLTANNTVNDGGATGAGNDGGVAERVDFVWDGVVLAEQHRTVRDDPAARVTTWNWAPGGFRPLIQSGCHLTIKVTDNTAPAPDGTAVDGKAGNDIATGNVATHGAATSDHTADGHADQIPGDHADSAHAGTGHAVGDHAGRSVGDGADQAWFDVRFHAIVTDLVGTPTDLVDPDGELAWHARTTLWGANPAPTNGGDIDCPPRFPGQYHDRETGAHYNYFRYYDPETTRYDSTDPHTYVPNPLGWLDPLGLAPYKVTVYHYTDRVGYNAIRGSNPYHIKPGASKNGSGPFFTDLSPDDSSRPNSFKNWDL